MKLYENYRFIGVVVNHELTKFCSLFYFEGVFWKNALFPL